VRVTVLFDGSCLHGVDGAGAAVAYDSSGVELARRARYLPGPDVTVNVAEYTGLRLALELARDLGATSVRVLGDSELIVRQFNLVYACRQEHLRPLLWQARDAAADLRCPVEVDVLPRAGPKRKRRFGNVDADALAGECRRARRDVP
jgi:ribonuclease HI